MLGSTADTSEMPALDSLVDDDFSSDEALDESDSLDVDLSGLADLPIDSDDFVDLGDSVSEVEDELANTSSDDSSAYAGDENLLSPETESMGLGDEDDAVFASVDELAKVAGDKEQDFEAEDVPDDTIEQPSPSVDSIDDTAEQPLVDAADHEVALEDEVAVTEATGMPEDATMTEVGTKLDLARAYIDMGDPDGAISILNEVLDEGGDAQQQEARQLLSELSD